MTRGPGPSTADLARSRDIAFRAVRAAGGSHEDADDVAQMTTVRLLQLWDTSGVRRARQSIGSTAESDWERYVRVVARRIWVDQIRKNVRRRANEIRSIEELPDAGDHDGPKVRRPRSPEVSNPVEQEVVLPHALAAEIEMIPDGYYVRFAKAWLVEGCGAAELARGVARTRSRSSIYRDRERLREYFRARDLISRPTTTSVA